MQRCQRQNQARRPPINLPSRSSQSSCCAGRMALPLGRPPPPPACSRARNLAWSREEGGSSSILLLIWKSESVHPRHSVGLFLPVANAERNASVLPQAKMGHFICAHRYRASPMSQVFHSNTGQQVHLFHVTGRVFPN